MKANRSFVSLVLFLWLPIAGSGQDRLSKGDHYASVNDIKIHYYVSGSGPVCLVPSPGWGLSVDYFRNSLTPFESFFTMVYYDTRLTGQSTGPDDPSKYSSRVFVEDMDALRMYLKLSKVWLMGHSSGGFQVLNYGIHHNDKLHGIIALNAFAALDEVNFMSQLHKIKVPVLIVVGDDDFICDKVSQSDRIATSIKGSTEIVINDAGHFCWVEQPEQFFTACKEWLERQSSFTTTKQDSGITSLNTGSYSIPSREYHYSFYPIL